MVKRVAIIFFLLIIVGLVYYFVDPLSAEWMPKCFSKTIFGISCPGCGTQRAIHSVLKGDIVAAFFYNPLLILSVPYFLLIGVLDIKSIRVRHPKLHNAILGQKSIWIMVSILLIYTIARNYFDF